MSPSDYRFRNNFLCCYTQMGAPRTAGGRRLIANPMAVDIWRSLRMVRSQPLLFFLGAVIGFVAMLVGPSLTSKPPMVYKSFAKILITPNTNSLSDATHRAVDPSVRAWFVDESTIRALLSSQDLLELVLESAGSNMSWLELRDRVSINILSRGGPAVSLLELSVTGNKAEDVRVLAQTLSEKFIQYVQQLSAAEHDKTVAFLERERRNAEREISRTHKRLLKLGVAPSNGRTNSLEEAWVQLQQRRNELERELSMAEAEVEQLDVAQAEGIETMISPEGAGTAVMGDAVAKEKLKLEQLREVFTEKSTQVQEQIGKVKRAEELMLRDFQHKVQARRQAAQRKRAHLSTLLAQTQQRLKSLEDKRPGPDKLLQYSTEERQLAMWQDSYLDLTRQLYRARVLQQSSRREGAFTIVEKPIIGKLVSGAIVNRSFGVRVLIAIPVGLIAGLGLVIAAEYFSSSMRLEPRIEEALGLPILGTIPTVAEDASTRWDTMKQNVPRPKSML